MSNKQSSASNLDVYDPNENEPSEPPPSYDEAMADPSIDIENESTSNHQQPLTLPAVNTPQKPSSNGYSRIAAPPPPIHHSQFHVRPTAAPLKKNSNDLYTNNLDLPWRYSKTYYCKKCKNTGYKTKNGHACKDCWGKFKPNITPPRTAQDLKYLLKHPPPPPKPLNPNVVKLPPGSIVRPMIMSPVAPKPLVVKPGDPRIGGVLCGRCDGRGMVHFFLDLDRCPICNGLGRVGAAGRPIRQ